MQNNGLHNHLRKLTQSVFTGNSKAYFFESKSISGVRLSAHVVEAEDTIKNYHHEDKTGPWDLVVLQGQSQEPINEKGADGFKDAARRLDEKIRNAGSRSAFFMTWAYKNAPEMTKPLSDAYTRLGNELSALVVPVGLAFDLARDRDPNMELYAKDKRHPSLLGTYLAANVFFATLYGKSPVGASYTAGLNNLEAKFAQITAWKTVQNYFGK